MTTFRFFRALRGFCILYLRVKNSSYFIIYCLILLTGCNPLAPAPSPTPDLPVTEIVQRSSEAMLKAKTMHFNITLSGALDYIDRPPTTALKGVEGDLLRPDKVRATVKVSTLGVVTQIGLISLGETSYVTNPMNQRWQLLPPEWGWYFDPRAPFDEQRGIPAIIPLVPMHKVGVEELEGQSYYHIAGTAQGEQITAWTAGMIASGDVPVELWIAPDTFEIRKVRLVETTSDEKRPTTWDIIFTQYDVPVEIVAPPVE